MGAMEHSGEVIDVLVVRNVILERVSIEKNINRENVRVKSGNRNGRRASYRKRGRMEGMRLCSGERGRRRGAWGSIQRDEKFLNRGKHIRSKGSQDGGFSNGIGEG